MKKKKILNYNELVTYVNVCVATMWNVYTVELGAYVFKQVNKYIRTFFIAK